MKRNNYIKTAPTKRVCSGCLTSYSRSQQSAMNRFRCSGCDKPKRTTLLNQITHCIKQSITRKKS